MRRINKLHEFVKAEEKPTTKGRFFLPVDSERILRIPLFEHLTDDFVAWHKMKSFVFTVWAAYYTEWDHQFGSRVVSTKGALLVNPVWAAVWKLNVPSKVKIYIWRALRGVISGMGVLANQHIMVSPQVSYMQGWCRGY